MKLVIGFSRDTEMGMAWVGQDKGGVITHLIFGEKAAEAALFFVPIQHGFKTGIVVTTCFFRLFVNVRFDANGANGADQETIAALMAIVTLKAPVPKALRDCIKIVVIHGAVIHA